MKFSDRAMNVEPSATVKVSNTAKAMIRKGIDVINLGIGEPDFTTPQLIADAAIKAIKSGKTSFYTPASGLPQLKEAIAERIKKDYGVIYPIDQISVTNGAKMALYVLMQALVDPGVEVLLPRPSWVSYKQQVLLAGGKPVIVETGDDFKITTDGLDDAVNHNTKVLVINSPQNPTGTIYSKEELEAIGNWAVLHNVILIADDIYGKLVYNQNQFYSLVQINDRIAASTILVNGVSKAYSMTGWRIGYVAGAPELISKVNSILSHTTGNPATVSQYAAIAALESDQSEVETMRQAFEQRLNTIYPLVEKIPGFKLRAKPEGAFYLFPDVSAAIQLAGVQSSGELVDRLLQEAHVAVVDGAAFGMPGYLRMSYATSLEDLSTAVERITAFMNQFLEKQVSGGIGIETD
ncbi:pyridoxal phosphate-dependent aminotransferase [Lentilactobacillus parabuchneri]|jgi:aspartate/methionine/tyrosine aminotransferase|uniref:Aminotransferase n=3 Tax=Lentilactobacillus parabuchneri TaxID=152331 RepID=A0A1X1FBR2_9LACO|nr:pyridoxal phosphate-dependent aminotransferase [Lentilactobacillus parabuchneri]APR08519.1 Aspartate aminotransferase [Lentilactobacillus parabuchneri]KRM47821.1 aspartate transaminase [Lentilactobacillus parabuchneri DSM 5707 = NBRC 107865]MBW0221895.1 pyridoxal phosphate-dependent aminotransferase [Lentilactobacillus parabuchneri]MBW0244881.1 pyridoxal phosphate-dependent aminotransferase [Lentilactobacillus parabuchneri]MBW0262959.1 pyridoxal phosphate-dependent aminotransferase [Lentila